MGTLRALGGAVVGVLLLSLLTGCGGRGAVGAPDGLQAGPKPAPGRVAFCRRAGGTDTYFTLRVMNSDGTGSRKIVDTNYNPMWPTWSPDGKKIAFQGQTSQLPGFSIYVINLATRKITRLSDGMFPDWSHDGHSIIFTREDSETHWHIWRMTPAGTSLIQVTDNPGGDYDPSWSSDDSRFVFTSNRDWYDNYAYSEIYSQRPVLGAQTRRHTEHPGVDEMPAAAPVGNKFVYCSGVDLNWELMLLDFTAEGTTGLRLTQNTADDVDPAWAPDGTQIVFASDRRVAHRFELYVINAGGGKPTHLTTPTTSDRFPAWGPPA